MKNLLGIFLLISLSSCKAQQDAISSIEFTSDLEKFENLSELKASLADVEIIALGENTHGLGAVFEAKVELVKFLHEELDFDLVLFESGFGDGALSWELIDSISAKEFTRIFSSNFYYQSEEIEGLVHYAKSQDKKLTLQGFDCQPQQNYLIKRMAKIVEPLDSLLAKSVQLEMSAFNRLYQFEMENDTLAFLELRDKFIHFLSNYENFIAQKTEQLHALGTTENELDVILKSIQMFEKTYSSITIGDLMGWPASANLRDKAMFENIMWYTEKYPDSKIIIWAQNSHIENRPKPNYTVNWMGHSLKSTFGDKYYSIGTIVYSGENLNYNGTFRFKHNDKAYLAYHLNKFQKERFVVDLRAHHKIDCTSQLLLGMENSGNTAKFIAKDRFDGLLFIQHSDPPKLLETE